MLFETNNVIFQFFLNDFQKKSFILICFLNLKRLVQVLNRYEEDNQKLVGDYDIKCKQNKSLEKKVSDLEKENFQYKVKIE